ncbi:hypothetical protein [Dickeya sp. NCPPB 3274]|uniref:hypothetical protein n=1 Tax=Dickeya sp. NCPPB 3274 TaxID=568766 RepID=UPI0012696771|nr:hypothetical protein [Dickeya sp. NCPPB 3274]
MNRFFIAIIALSLSFSAFSADSYRGKSENEQVVEYLKSVNTIKDAVVMGNLTTNIENGKVDFNFIRISSFKTNVRPSAKISKKG